MMREDASELAKSLNVIGLDLTPEARTGLLDGVVDVILSHPIKLIFDSAPSQVFDGAQKSRYGASVALQNDWSA